MVLQEQVAVVTGAARGIGEAIARRLAAMGVTAVITARDMSRLEKLQQEIKHGGGKAEAIACDLTHAGSVAAMAKRVQETYKRCDILVNNAGIGLIGKPLHELAVEDWDLLMGTNLRGPYLMMRAFAPMMIAAGSGHIINISSLAGKNPLANGAAYSASKWGLNGLSYSVAEELRQYNIRVSLIAPGSVNTGFGGAGQGGGKKDPGKKIQPDDIAHVVEMLVTQAPQSFVSEVLVRPTTK